MFPVAYVTSASYITPSFVHFTKDGTELRPQCVSHFSARSDPSEWPVGAFVRLLRRALVFVSAIHVGRIDPRGSAMDMVSWRCARGRGGLYCARTGPWVETQSRGWDTDHTAGCRGFLVEVLTVEYGWWKDISSMPSWQVVSRKNMNGA